MLAKKEYELIAGVIRSLPKHPSPPTIILAFANRFRLDNPKFDRDKFIKACSKSE